MEIHGCFNICLVVICSLKSAVAMPLLNFNQDAANGLLNTFLGGNGLVTKLINEAVKDVQQKPTPPPFDQPKQLALDEFAINQIKRETEQREAQRLKTRVSATRPNDFPAPVKNAFDPENVADGITAFMSELRARRGYNFQFKDLPSLGLCNQESCPDIYSALDNVRRSPWMSNIQTMLLLLNDKDGVETIGKILQDPSVFQGLISGKKAFGNEGDKLDTGNFGGSDINFGDFDENPIFEETIAKPQSPIVPSVFQNAHNDGLDTKVAKPVDLSFSQDYYSYYDSASGTGSAHLASGSADTTVQKPAPVDANSGDYYDSFDNTDNVFNRPPKVDAEEKAVFVETSTKPWRMFDEYYAMYYDDNESVTQ